MRPAFHFTASRGWINDPHGITYRDNGYDVFYQYVPEVTRWQPNCHWGHARGDDLLSLHELPVAIAPGDGDGGIWTGSLVVDDGGAARVFYTATNEPDFGIGHIRTATPTDAAWVGWQKGDVVVLAPDDLDLIAYRDPFVRREGDRWRMFVGAGASDGTALALSYVSDDGLDSWRYDGITLARSTHETTPVWTGALWECPQIFEIGDRYAMVSSVWDADNLHYAAYALGDYRDGRFLADTWGRLTYGPSYYAPSLFHDAQGRPCLSFWMRGIADPADGWASAHSLPHLLSVDAGQLVARPHPDVERYRSRVPDDGQALDIDWRSVAGECMAVRRGTQTVATLLRLEDTLRVEVGNDTYEMPAAEQVRVVIDGPVIEVATGGSNFGHAIGCPPGELRIETTARSVDIYQLCR